MDHFDPDWPVRSAAFAALRELVARNGPVLPWSAFQDGFRYAGQPFRFANQSKGIFRPAGMVAGALSIKTTVARNHGLQRYDDVAHDDAFQYAFQRRGIDYHDNQLLVRAYELRAPVIYFYGVEPGYYRPLWPAYVADVDAGAKSYKIVVDDAAEGILEPGAFVADDRALSIQRQYATAATKRRLHQELFAHLVLSAYRERCAICNLPRRSLLDAAHIVPDRDQRGVPAVPNGLALCKLHHAAFDANLLGIRPDAVVEICSALLNERDGPTLEHAIKGFDGKKLRLPLRPSDRPNREFLEIRYDAFRRSA